jgi:U3 small nucleolar ribonucleoprotein protein IMP3
MVRKLKHHEQKLLKKVDFYEKNRRVSEVMHRYHIQRREDYTKYNRLCGQSKATVAVSLAIGCILMSCCPSS